MDEFIDLMSQPGVPQLSRWSRGEGATAIAALDEALVKAGLPNRLEAPKRLLDRGEELAGQARAAKQAAADRLEQANRLLLAGGHVDVTAYGRVLVEVGPWLDDQAAGMVGVMQASHRATANASQTVFAMAGGLYQELQRVCAEVVAEVAAVPALPRAVWAAAGIEAPSVAIRAGCEGAWATLVRAGDQWDRVHQAAGLLRETGVFQQELIFPGGCPSEVGSQFLGWQDAVEHLAEVRRLPGPLRLRAAVDRGWRPGLYLATDHVADRERAAAKPRGLLARLVG
jgi:hypothetical protein